MPEKLVFLSDIEGVYNDKDDPSSLISDLLYTKRKTDQRRLCRRWNDSGNCRTAQSDEEA